MKIKIKWIFPFLIILEHNCLSKAKGIAIHSVFIALVKVKGDQNIPQKMEVRIGNTMLKGCV